MEPPSPAGRARTLNIIDWLPPTVNSEASADLAAGGEVALLCLGDYELGAGEAIAGDPTAWGEAYPARALWFPLGRFDALEPDHSSLSPLESETDGGSTRVSSRLSDGAPSETNTGPRTASLYSSGSVGAASSPRVRNRFWRSLRPRRVGGTDRQGGGEEARIGSAAAAEAASLLALQQPKLVFRGGTQARSGPARASGVPASGGRDGRRASIDAPAGGALPAAAAANPGVKLVGVAGRAGDDGQAGDDESEESDVEYAPLRLANDSSVPAGHVVSFTDQSTEARAREESADSAESPTQAAAGEGSEVGTSLSSQVATASSQTIGSRRRETQRRGGGAPTVRRGDTRASTQGSVYIAVGPRGAPVGGPPSLCPLPVPDEGRADECESPLEWARSQSASVKTFGGVDGGDGSPSSPRGVARRRNRRRKRRACVLV